ncbi:MAG: Trm112 family protein [Candidatus Nanopelagicales bacterium]|nr:Trm112 family protein [Candidatus Nanopelagicales bacterium]MDZ4249915.1 Trm112 family protein [Candidatus Nanopelagicales bacterium]MDZ7578935.1 Trm112 family protein [Candidatus Nanopelagicales bacterium]
MPEDSLGIDPLLRELLRCPCPEHVELDDDLADSELVCRRCATRFPVRDGLPVMLLDEATAGPAGVGEVAG